MCLRIRDICQFHYKCFRDIWTGWSSKRRILFTLLVIFAFSSLPIVLVWYYYPEAKATRRMIDITTLVALFVTWIALYDSVVLSESLEPFIGIDEYVTQAAKRYLKAQNKVFGVLQFWKVGMALEEALLNCRCNDIIFVGNISAESVPGVLWRLHHINTKRKNSNPPLVEMKIHHVRKTPLLFVVIDNDTVLVEEKDLRRGRIFDSNNDLATAYAKVITSLYHHVIDAESKVLELMYGWIKNDFSGQTVPLKQLEDLVIGKTGFRISKEYRQYIGETNFREYIRCYIGKMLNKSQYKANISHIGNNNFQIGRAQ